MKCKYVKLKTKTAPFSQHSDSNPGSNKSPSYGASLNYKITVPLPLVARDGAGGGT